MSRKKKQHGKRIGGARDLHVAALRLGLPGTSSLATLSEIIATKWGRPVPIDKIGKWHLIGAYVDSGWGRPPAAPRKILPRPDVRALDDFLLSYEWRRCRMTALVAYGARCQCCGATAKDGIRINVDHIKPRKLFPHLALDPSNLQVLCDVCNHGKGNWDETDWREVSAWKQIIQNDKDWP